MPRLGLNGNISFIFDTGADTSLLMPLDAWRIGVNYAELHVSEQSLGIGGVSTNFIEPAFLAFVGDSELYGYEIQLGICKGSAGGYASASCGCTWRRVDVPLTSHLLTPHYIIQIAFGWTDSHLFQFTIGNRNYSVPSEEDEFWGLKFYRAAGLRLRTLVARGVERFVFVYDFGWVCSAWRGGGAGPRCRAQGVEVTNASQISNPVGTSQSRFMSTGSGASGSSVNISSSLSSQ